MTDDYDEQDDQEPTPRPRDLRQQIDELHAQVAELRPLAEQAPELQRKIALYEAGLPADLSETKRKAIIATAEDTTPEGFRKAAEELGFMAPPAPPEPPADLSAHDRISAAQSGGTTPDPAAYEAEIAGANTAGEVATIMARYGKELTSPVQ